MSELPDELWRRILEFGINTCGFTYKDLCCVSISCRRLHRLSDESSLWSHLLSSDFPLTTTTIPSSSISSTSSKSVYRLRFERDKERKIAAHKRAVLRKESQISGHYLRLRDIEVQIGRESERIRETVAELSNLHRVRQASAALKVWQPEVIRGRQKQIVEQCVVPSESRIHSLEMELRLCKQQIKGFEKSYENEKQRLDTAKEELESMKYHPLRYHMSMDSGENECNIKCKKLKRCKTGCQKKILMCELLGRKRIICWMYNYS
ncbi:F-box protein skip24-like [Quillaja saponaria]|uniref:F-box protein skip24-like n=1 Tax=Quillaja saponaria TaxID=32244 RepID=A0AAD7PZD5_QUISA|nr:F-box protein skip24-like [Quillaja saponaria]